MKKLIIDSDIPYIRGVFEPFFEVAYLKGCDISSSEVDGVSGMVIRTRTHCDAQLLDGSAIEAIATATIGTDHIDLDYCASKNISVFSSAGCNARAVAQWVFSVIEELKNRGKVKDGFTLGIIGVGNVGREVLSVAESFGVKVLLSDAPREEREGSLGFLSVEELLTASDVVTLHVSLGETSRGMVTSDFLSKMRTGSVLLNSSRGEVVCEDDLLASDHITYCLDVWGGEPNINLELLEGAELASPHIAGYSARGKARATSMCVAQIAQYFGIQELMGWDCASGYSLESPLECDILSYDSALRACPSQFENQRTIRG